jgi:DNA replication protein DnaC
MLRNSVALWKNLPKDIVTEEDCETCQSMGMVDTEIEGKVTRVFCHCRLAWWEKAQAKELSKISRLNYNTMLPSIDDFFLRENYEIPMQTALDAAKDVIASPMNARWLFISGGVGTGKTHLLQSVYAALPGYAVYLRGGGITDLIFGSFDDNSTEELIETLVSVPVLIVDDMGVDETWNNTVRNKVVQIIDGRYQYRKHRPTLVATNLTKQETRNMNARVASRVLDQDLSTVLYWKMSDWRERDNIAAVAAQPKKAVRRKS